MSISFRTRLFAITITMVMTVMTAVFTLGWLRVLKSEVARLDDRLCMEARRLAREPHRVERIDRLEADMQGKLRLSSSRQLMLRLELHDASVALQSTHWDADLNLDALSWAPLARSPPQHDERPRRLRTENGLDTGQRDDQGSRSKPPPLGDCELASFAASGSQWRSARIVSTVGRAVVAADLAATKSELLGDMREALQWVIPLAITLAALGAWLLSSITMRPVNRLRNAMSTVTQRALDRRLPSHGEDQEFKELIEAYNTMLQRLESSFRQASRFSADAAHELRTPLTILQGRIERAMAAPSDPEATVDLPNLLDEVGRLSAITRKLLLLSRADAGQLALNIEAVDLCEMLHELVSDAQLYGGECTVSSAIKPGLVVHGDGVLLRQMLNNVVSNAVRYCKANGWVHVRAKNEHYRITIGIANSTDPIPMEERKRFFHRFYRGDASHSRKVEGSGLGLSLAREIARAHQGELTLEPSPDDEVRLTITLPKR